MTHHYLAVDLGAESGRLILGALEDGKLRLEEIHRFPNTPITSGGSLHWNISALFAELKSGLKRAEQLNVPIASISTDSWGVDYLLFDAKGELVSPTFHYRDPRTAEGVKKTMERMSWNELFAETGIQFMPLNTVFQLMAEQPARLQSAALLLGVGDGFNYYLSGVAAAERSLASTMQLYNPEQGTWASNVFERLNLPKALFAKIVEPGTILGPLRRELFDGDPPGGALGEHRGKVLPLQPGEGRGEGPQVIATCSHDTGAAVVGVPASGSGWAYLSSGTWSLLGVELEKPIMAEAAREANFTNEVGFGNTIRLLKNIIGLWLVQECRREWAQNGSDYDYAELAKMAEEAKPFVSLINPADPRFLSPGNIPKKIAAACAEKGEPLPESPGATIRCALESLALLYARTLHQVENVTSRKIDRLHIVGGGSKNELLNQLTANAAQVPVIAGPVEATAAGNVLVQAIALEHLKSIDDAREVVRQSFEVRTYQPRDAALWTAARERFERIISR